MRLKAVLLLALLSPLAALAQGEAPPWRPGEGTWLLDWKPRLALTLEAGAHNVPRAPLDPATGELPLYLGMSASWWALPYGALQVSLGTLRPHGETQVMAGVRMLVPMGGMLSLVPDTFYLGVTLQGGLFLGATGMGRRVFSPGAGFEWRAHPSVWLGAGWANDLVDGLGQRSRLYLTATFFN